MSRIRNLIGAIVFFFSSGIFACPVVDQWGLANYSPMVLEEVTVTLKVSPADENQVIGDVSAVVSDLGAYDLNSGSCAIQFPEAKDYTVTGKIKWKDPADQEMSTGPLSVKAYAYVLIDDGDGQKVPKDSVNAEKLKVYLGDVGYYPVKNVKVNFSEGTTPASATSGEDGIAAVDLKVDTAAHYTCKVTGATGSNVKAPGVTFDETVFSLTLTSENVTVTRGTPGISVTVVPDSFLPDSFIWTFTGGVGGSKTTANNKADVVLVDSDNPYTVKCKILYGDNKNYETAKANIVVQKRPDWSLVSVCSCKQDNDSTWGDFPGARFGQFCNTHEKENVAILPSDSSGATLSQISSGPNNGYWYVSSSSYAINTQTLINKYIKSGTIPPTPPGVNWYEYNKAHGVDTDKFLVAVKNHEYIGNGIGGGGHYAHVLTFASKDEYNLIQLIESYYSSTNKNELEVKIQSTRNNCNEYIWGWGDPRGNWSGNVYLYVLNENNWMFTDINL